MQDQLANSNKKVTLNCERHEVIFTLNCQSKPHTLDIQCKEIDSSSELWGSYKFTDLEPHFQAIFDKIDTLFNYISDNAQDVEIQQRSVVLMLKFLKQSKVIRLQLSEMIRCSADVQKKQLERIKYLELQNESLKNMAKGEGAAYDGCKKLAMPMTMNLINLDSYKISNLRQISPIPNNYLRNLFKLNPSLMLPQKGLWSFQMIVTSFIRQRNDKSYPLIQIGLKNEQNQTLILTLNSNMEPYVYSCDQNTAKSQNFLHQNDHLRFIFNMDAKMLAVQRNFGESELKYLNWESLKGSKLWLSLRLYMTNIKTDLFVEQRIIDWQCGAH